MRFRSSTLDQLIIDDERSFRHVALYEQLKGALLRDGYRFRVPQGDRVLPWDRALFLNLTFWEGEAAGGDVLVEGRIPADVVAHAAWHHLARRALSRDGRLSAQASLMGEAIASAFDLYLVGRLIGHAPESDFLATQVPAMSDVAEAAGVSERDFEQMLEETSKDPDRAFEDLRALLFDATTSLLWCSSPDEAAAALEPLEARRFAPLLHHYELSNWILAARVQAGPDRAATDHATVEVDRALRAAPVALDWLEAHWVASAHGAVG
jgi:hypothetical protein